MKTRALLVMFIITITLVAPLHGEEGLETARRIYTQFWNDAMQIEKTDFTGREEIRKRAAALPETMEPSLTKGIIEYLNGTEQPSSDSLKRKLSEALTAPMLSHTAEGVADVLSSQSGEVFVVAYAVSYCASCSRTWLGQFARQNGRFYLKSTIRDSLPDQMVHLAPLAVPSAQLTFLLYGVHLGDAHNRLNAQAFRTDGTLRTLWSKLDLPQGQIYINDNHITFDYLSSMAPPWKERTEEYAADQNGFHLIHESER